MVSGCEAIVAQVAGLKELVDAFRNYARMPGVTPRPSSVSQIVREVGSLYEGLKEDLDVKVELPSDELQANVDPVLLRQALVNLFDNAIDATLGSGSVSVAARRHGNDIILEVSDDGAGLPTDDVEMLLQPFFSTKGRGSGMGLALVHRIVTDHGGALELENRSPAGAVARIVLPDTVHGDVSAPAEGEASPRDPNS
jgi:nitrogen fixation/metabolism regulation signal transduction histidine kinase